MAKDWSTASRLAAIDEPVKFLTGARSGVMGADEFRMLNVPRCFVRFTDEIPHTGGVTSGSAYTAANVVQDSDNMTHGGTATPFIYCNTPGVYAVGGLSAWSGGGVAQVWTRICINNNASTLVSSNTDARDAATFGIHLPVGGLWIANKGDNLSLLQFSNINVNVDNQYLAVAMISSMG